MKKRSPKVYVPVKRRVRKSDGGHVKKTGGCGCGGRKRIKNR
ncbi:MULTISPECIES: hypothetical protein [Bacillaceae]|nr:MULTISPECIES: hypothetical protein [Bacillaceae]